MAVCVGSDVSSGERRASDCQDPPRRHDRPARSAPCGRHHQGGEWQGGGQRPQSAPGDAEGGEWQRGAEDPAQLPGATYSETGQLRAQATATNHNAIDLLMVKSLWVWLIVLWLQLIQFL